MQAHLGHNGAFTSTLLHRAENRGRLMKNLVWIVVAAIIAVGGYVLYSGRSVQELASDVT
jgi:hypothetical protein